MLVIQPESSCKIKEIKEILLRCTIKKRNKEIPKVDSNHTCLVVISLDSASEKDDNFYPQVFIKDCKYI